MNDELTCGVRRRNGLPETATRRTLGLHQSSSSRLPQLGKVLVLQNRLTTARKTK